MDVRNHAAQSGPGPRRARHAAGEARREARASDGAKVLALRGNRPSRPGGCGTTITYMSRVGRMPGHRGRLSAPVGKPATGDFGRFSNSAAQAALQQYESSGSATVQKDAITKLQQIMTSQVPVVPLLYGGAWAEYSTRNYTGWPTASNPYMTPVPNTPYLLYTVLQLKPKS